MAADKVRDKGVFIVITNEWNGSSGVALETKLKGIWIFQDLEVK